MNSQAPENKSHCGDDKNSTNPIESAAERDQILDEYAPWGSMKDRGFTELHVAMNSIAPIDSIRVLLRMLPNACSRRETREGMTPLLVGLQKYGYHAVAIKAVVTACPEAARLADHTGRLPLHYCLEYDVSLGALQAALDAFPQASNVRDQMGRTPLIVGLMRGANEDCIRALLQHNPSSVFKKYEGWTPLHGAMGCSVSAGVVKALLETSPSPDVAALDNDGRTPLHVAMGMGIIPETIKVLINACPRAAQVRDHEGWYPLHHGIRYKAPQESCHLVREAYPEAWEDLNNQGGGHNQKPYELDTTRVVASRPGYRIKGYRMSSS